MINCSQVIEKARNKEYVSQTIEKHVPLISAGMFLHSEPMGDSSPRENIIDVKEDGLGPVR